MPDSHDGTGRAWDRLGIYVLEPDHSFRRARDVAEWAAFRSDAQRSRVARDTVEQVPALVSTVFLGIDHAFGGGPPILFETMVFGGPLDREQWRWHTWIEAEAGHVVVLELVRDSVAK